MIPRLRSSAAEALDEMVRHQKHQSAGSCSGEHILAKSDWSLKSLEDKGIRSKVRRHSPIADLVL